MGGRLKVWHTHRNRRGTVGHGSTDMPRRGAQTCPGGGKAAPGRAPTQQSGTAVLEGPQSGKATLPRAGKGKGMTQTGFGPPMTVVDGLPLIKATSVSCPGLGEAAVGGVRRVTPGTPLIENLPE